MAMDLTTLKSLLGLAAEDTSKDVVLQFAMDYVTEAIKDYCHVDAIPDGLDYTAYEMAVDYVQNSGVGSMEAPMAAKAVTMGDFSATLDRTASAAYEAGILKNYKGRLNRYRKLVWP